LVWRQTKKAFEEANNLKADIIPINMNKHEGTEIDSDSIRTKNGGHKPVLINRIIGLFTNPFVSGILIIAIFCGIYFEMQSPGIRSPMIVAITAMISYFAPLYIEGLAENWEIALFIIGLILVAIEIFVVPGSGITGILGVSFIFVGLTLSLLNNERLSFENVHGHSILIALITVSFSLITGFFLSLWLSKKLYAIQN
jgi:membrane-bound serine protease (ClpP class)